MEGLVQRPGAWSAGEASPIPPYEGGAGESNGSTGEASPIPPCKGGAGEAAWSAGEAFLIPPCKGLVLLGNTYEEDFPGGKR
jgi:hypothetical protein